jgi:serine/threonine protein kinase
MQEYVVRRLIGEGAFGEVYLATDRRNGRKVAIKKLAKALIPNVAELDRAMQELSILSSLNHANVIKLLEVVSDTVSVGLVMEYAGALAEGRGRRRPHMLHGAHAQPGPSC